MSRKSKNYRNKPSSVTPFTGEAEVPFGREMLAVIRKCGQRPLRQVVPREGGGKRNLVLVREQ